MEGTDAKDRLYTKEDVDAIGVRFRGEIGGSSSNAIIGEWAEQGQGNLTYSQKFVDAMTRRLEGRIRDQESKVEYLRRELVTKDLRVRSPDLDSRT